MAGSKSKSKEIRNLRLVLVGVICLQVALLLTTRGILGGRIGPSEAVTNPSSFFPFWLVVFIPIIASKIGKITDKDQRRGFWVLIGISFLVLLTMAAFLLSSLT